jgi:hypothetical protein
MADVEEGVQGASETVIVELGSGDAAEEFVAGLVGPPLDVDQSSGAAESSGNQGGEDLSVGEVTLRVVGEESVEDVLEAELLEQGKDEGKGTGDPSVQGQGAAAPGESRHARAPVVAERARRLRVRGAPPS